MIKVENIEVWGWKHAIRGMRNPMNSWDKSDSCFCPDEPACEGNCSVHIGPNDLSLMQKLFNGGTEHRKYLRQIFVSLDITAPLYWWKEFDTYKVGTVANSCSTMHKIQAKEFTTDDFSYEHLISDHTLSTETPVSLSDYECYKKFAPKQILECWVIPALNKCREVYLATQEKAYWWQMIQLLPSSYNQRRTVTMSYENVFTILRQRKGHKLDEWRNLCEILNGLPNVKEIGGLE